MGEQHSGSCLCGAVRFRVDGVFERFYFCHCSHCRKDTGSAHAATLFSASATLQWLSGRDRVTHFNLPETRHGKSFCATCGSALPWATPRGVVVPAGALDTAVVVRPDGHIFTASRAEWDWKLEDAPSFPGPPV